MYIEIKLPYYGLPVEQQPDPKVVNIGPFTSSEEAIHWLKRHAYSSGLDDEMSGCWVNWALCLGSAQIRPIGSEKLEFTPPDVSWKEWVHSTYCG